MTSIILGVCGGIAAYKSAELTRLLARAGHEVQVILTKSGEEFITPLTLQTLSGHPVHRDLFSLSEAAEINHIALADRAQLVLVAPATADCLARVAHGLCNDLLTTVICATRAPVVFAPAMNVHMWENTITQRNVRLLTECGYHIIPPATGEMACGHTGAGRLPEPAELVSAIERWLS